MTDEERLCPHHAGAPATSCTECDSEDARRKAMRLRDEFAMAALSGLISGWDWSQDKMTPGHLAHRAYLVADAMCEARVLAEKEAARKWLEGNE